MIRVIIVDDHAIVRSGLANFLNALDDLALVGETGSGADAVQLCDELHPDVVMMDLVMPEMNGVEATRAIHARYPDLPVLILSSFGDDDMVQEALQAGAIGYLLKNTSIHDMARAIRAAHAGQPTLSPEATQALIRAHTRMPDPAIESERTRARSPDTARQRADQSADRGTAVAERLHDQVLCERDS